MCYTTSRLEYLIVWLICQVMTAHYYPCITIKSWLFKKQNSNYSRETIKQSNANVFWKLICFVVSSLSITKNNLFNSGDYKILIGSINYFIFGNVERPFRGSEVFCIQLLAKRPKFWVNITLSVGWGRFDNNLIQRKHATVFLFFCNSVFFFLFLIQLFSLYHFASRNEVAKYYFGF